MFGRSELLAGSRRGRLGDAAHPDRVVVAPGQQRLPRRRTQRRRVEAVEPQSSSGQPIGSGRPTRAAERARRTESDIVEQHDQDVRSARRRQQRLDRRKRGVRVLRVVRRETRRRAVGDRQAAAKVPVCAHACPLSRVTARWVAGSVANDARAVARRRTHPLGMNRGHRADQNARAERHDQPDRPKPDREPKGDRRTDHQRGRGQGAPAECCPCQSQLEGEPQELRMRSFWASNSASSRIP